MTGWERDELTDARRADEIEARRGGARAERDRALDGAHDEEGDDDVRR